MVSIIVHLVVYIMYLRLPYVSQEVTYPSSHLRSYISAERLNAIHRPRYTHPTILTISSPKTHFLREGLTMFLHG